jgi:hypothetical protein
MIKSNLLEILRKFSSKELKEFGEFVRSPFFNKNESAIKLYDHVRKYSPDFNDSKLEKEYAYRKIFPGTSFNDGFMRTIMFNLSKLAEEFLAYSNYKISEFNEKKNLLTQLNIRELDKMFEKNMREITLKLQKIHVKDVNYYFNQFLIEDENLIYLTKYRFEQNDRYIKTTGIENIFNNLTYFYLIRILKYYVYVLNTRSIYKVEFKTKLVEDLLAGINPALYEDIPLVKIYINMVMLHLKEDEEHYYYELKDLVKKHDKIFQTEDLNESFINLGNYCRRKIRKGVKKFNQELFQIYKMELEKGSYSVHNALPHKLYRGVVELGLKLEEFDWIWQFIEKYKKDLRPEFRENTYNHCLALYEFSKGNFENALRISSKVKYDDVYQKLELKGLIAALYYELDMEEQLISSFDSFRHIISNDTLVPEERKESYMKFLRFVKKMLRLKNVYSHADHIALKKSLISEKHLFN